MRIDGSVFGKANFDATVFEKKSEVSLEVKASECPITFNNCVFNGESSLTLFGNNPEGDFSNCIFYRAPKIDKSGLNPTIRKAKFMGFSLEEDRNNYREIKNFFKKNRLKA